jgi:membrane associated rhomboid family serine protease
MVFQRPSDPNREPMFNAPRVILLLLVALLLIHGLRGLMNPDSDAEWLFAFAFVPARFSLAIGWDSLDGLIATMRATSAAPDEHEQLGRFLLETGGFQPSTLVTYALLHGSWTHVILNSVWILAFGAPVARRLGAGRTVVLLAVTAAAGALGQWVVDPVEIMPLVGASASASGLMAASLRFAFGALGRPVNPSLVRLRSLREIWADKLSRAFLLIWLVTNVGIGLLGGPLGLVDGTIAWEAHIGGFVAGLLLMPFIDRRRPI